jgi:hypothetical protein
VIARMTFLGAIALFSATPGCGGGADEIEKPRIIKIQIEGCTDVPAQVIVAAAAASPALAAGTGAVASSTSGTAMAAVNATPVEIAPAVRIALATPSLLSGEDGPSYIALRRDIDVELDRKQLSTLDIPEVSDEIARADQFANGKNFREAMIHLAVAESHVRAAVVTHKLVVRKQARVTDMVEESRGSLSGEHGMLKKALDEADNQILAGNNDDANSKLFKIESRLNQLREKQGVPIHR